MKLGICYETHESRIVISIGYMASRFKSKLRMVFSHCPHPNGAVQVMLPSRRLPTSRRRGECRCQGRIECDNSARISAVESVVQAIAGTRSTWRGDVG